MSKKFTRTFFFFSLFLIVAVFSMSCRLAADLAERIRSTGSKPVPSGLIAYVGTDGNLYTIDRDGGNRKPLTQDANPQPLAGDDHPVYRFPTWAPDGEQIAFVEFRNLGLSDQRARVLSLDVSRRAPAVELFSSEQYFPFYLFWSPDSRLVSFLSNAAVEGDLALHSAAADGGGTRLVETGQPFYWDWSPLEDEILIHTGGSAAANPEARLALLAMDDSAASEAVDLRPGAFQAPAWSPDGRYIALVADKDGGDALLLLDQESGEQHEFAITKGLATFSWSPDGSSLAYTTPSSDGRQRALYQHQPGRSAESRLLSAGLITAFFWSPDGSHIAIFEPTLIRPGEDVSFELQEPAEVYMSLKVLEIDSGMSRHLVNFDPSEAFLNLLPFYDQYQRSIRLWSPDSRALVVTALDEQSAPGVYTIDIVSGTFLRIASGDMAFWSWK